MAQFTNIARLGVRGIACDCDAINARLTEIENSLCDCEAISNSLTELRNDITEIQGDITTIRQDIVNLDQKFTSEIENIWNHIAIIEQSVEISDVRTVIRNTQNGFPPSDLMFGLGTSVISIGPTYNYWGVGTLSGSHTWTQDTNVYLATPAEFPELAWYQGNPTMGTVWFQNMQGGSLTKPEAIPIYFDATGIYIHPTSQMQMNSGATFRFTQPLILVNPNPATP
ncbi:MAG: hypothetical protein FWD58_01450 [Firmicutes bacterium]|nr:hypothetical protein [Bacillota bacterium]